MQLGREKEAEMYLKAKQDFANIYFGNKSDKDW